MRILFDHQIYSNQNYGGISLYFYELSKGLTSLGNECQNSIYFSENEFVNDREFFNSRSFIPFRFKGRQKVKEQLNQLISTRLLKKGDYDIFHPTYYDTYFLKSKLPKKPFVVTFHDLIHEKFSERYPTLLTNMDEVISTRTLLLEKATQVIAVSQSTKRDVVAYYGVAPERIHVTHLASSIHLEGPKQMRDYGDYVLFVGTRMGYKNFALFLEAIAPLLRREKQLKLISAGGGSFKEHELDLISKLGVGEQVIQVPIDYGLLATLYRNALFFVFPSLYEGFGLPILEALNCGCPAILSNVSSLPEVGGDAAMYIEPENPSDILEKCELLYNDTALRKEYHAKGLERAREFSWEKLSRETLDVYLAAREAF